MCVCVYVCQYGTLRHCVRIFRNRTRVAAQKHINTSRRFAALTRTHMHTHTNIIYVWTRAGCLSVCAYLCVCKWLWVCLSTPLSCYYVQLPAWSWSKHGLISFPIQALPATGACVFVCVCVYVCSLKLHYASRLGVTLFWFLYINWL